MSESNNNYLGNPDRPVLVKESWAKRVQAATAATERDAAFYGETGRPVFALSRFYDMRPVMLKSNWTQNQAGVYTATAAFVVSDAGAIDSSFLFPVYSIPGFTPSGTVDETIFFVVWRGRWEAIPMGGDGAVVAPFSLYTNWVDQGSGLYKATAKQIISDNGATDPTPVDVFAIVTAGVPAGTAGAWKFWATWRNDRWETLQPVFPGVKNYVSGDYIVVSTSYDSSKGGYPITNDGVLYFHMEGSGDRHKGAIEIDKLYFQWVSSDATLGTKLSLKTKRINVVTGITNGQPVKELIRVLDA